KDEDKSKQQNIEALRRENTLVMRLTTKEQELQDCMNQIQEMKAGQTTSMAQLRTMLLDPAVNLIFQRITKEMEENKEKLKQTQNELSAWKFTPDRCLSYYHGNIINLSANNFQTLLLPGDFKLCNLTIWPT
ncbi:hypothetical protein LOTGIDRAFT_107020, partial [Lottia gigantea]